jgi:hypothetical protein
MPDEEPAMAARRKSQKKQPATIDPDEFYVVQSVRRTTGRLKAYTLFAGRDLLVKSAPHVMAVALAARGGVRPAAETAATVSGKIVAGKLRGLRAASLDTVDQGREWADLLQEKPVAAIADMVSMGVDFIASRKAALSAVVAQGLNEGVAVTDGLKSDLRKLAAMEPDDAPDGLITALEKRLARHLQRVAALMDMPSRGEVRKLQRAVRDLERRVRRLDAAGTGSTRKGRPSRR